MALRMVLRALAPPATRGPKPPRTARPARFSAGRRRPHPARRSPGRLHPMTTPSAVRSTRRGVPPANHVWPATVESVVPARDEVVRFARSVGASRRTLDDIKLATSEACTNAVLHAYAPEHSDTPTFLVSFESLDGEIVVQVRDHGSGLAPRPNSSGLGLGLALIAEVARAVAITTAGGGGTQLRMCFSIDAAAKGLPNPASRCLSW